MVSDRVLFWPTVTLPKLRGEAPATSEPGVAPVPDARILSDGLDASLVTVRIELTNPLVVGANRTLKVVLAPAASEIGKVAPVTLYAPEAAILLMLIVVPPELVRVS